MLILVSFGFVPTPAQAEIIAPITVEYSTSTAPLVLNYYARKYGIDAEQFTATARCESHFRHTAVGDGGNSFGVFQIHLPSHPTIGKDQALDPWFNIEWSAQQFAAGKQKMWTCYRNLFL